MKFSPDNDWQDRTSAGHLRALMGIYETRHGSNEYPTSRDACMQMLSDRIHLYAECGYSSYTHGWESTKLPKDYTLEEILELAEEAFIDCEVTLTPKYIPSCVSSSSTPEIVETIYELTIDWSGIEQTETTEYLQEKWNDSKERQQDKCKSDQ